MDVAPTTSELLVHFLKHCPATAHQPLGFLACDRFVRDGPSDPAAAVKSLTENFPRQSLTASGLLVQDKAGELALRDGLAPGQAFVVLVGRDTRRPVDLLTQAGCLLPGSLPALEVLGDKFTLESLKATSGRLAVVFDWEDLLLLRAVGVPATLAAGLADFPLDLLLRFCREFGLDLPTSEGSAPAGELPLQEPAALSELEMVFVAWSPHTLSPTVPAQLAELVAEWKRLGEFLEFGFAPVKFWTASLRLQASVHYLAQKRNAGFFAEVLLNALDEGLPSLTEFGNPPPEPPPHPDYATALDELFAANARESSQESSYRDPFGRDPKQEAWQNAQGFLERDIIAPIRQQALQVGDPILRAMMLSLAEMTSHFHRESVRTRLAQSQEPLRPSAEMAAVFLQPLSSLVALSNQVYSLSKAILECQNRKTTIHPLTPIESKPTPRLPHYD